MNSHNHPENQKTHGQHDLVQITKSNKPCESSACVSRETIKPDLGQMPSKANLHDGSLTTLIERRKTDPLPKARNPKPWVVVEGAGTDDENIVSDHGTFAEAHRAVFYSYDQTEIETVPVDIMKRNNDGTLTTEF